MVRYRSQPLDNSSVSGDAPIRELSPEQKAAILEAGRIICKTFQSIVSSVNAAMSSIVPVLREISYLIDQRDLSEQIDSWENEGGGSEVNDW
jgi:hypothetical protein